MDGGDSKTEARPKVAHGGRREGAGRPPSRPGKRVAHVSRGAHQALVARPRYIALAVAKAAKPGCSQGFRARHRDRQRPSPGAFSRRALLAAEGPRAPGGRGRVRAGAIARHARAGRAVGSPSSIGCCGDGARSGPIGFHSRRLLNAAEVRRVLVYVHANHRKHEPALRPGVDPYSSGIWFTGWEEARPLPLSIAISERLLDLERAPVARARTPTPPRRLEEWAARISLSEAPSQVVKGDR